MKKTENFQFSTYVENDEMKQRLLSYEWIVIRDSNRKNQSALKGY